MEVKLSKDTDKILCRIYNEYLKRRKAGESKTQAKTFSEDEQIETCIDPEIHPDDFHSAVSELKKVFGIKVYTAGGFLLNDELIAYMENRDSKSETPAITINVQGNNNFIGNSINQSNVNSTSAETEFPKELVEELNSLLNELQEKTISHESKIEKAKKFLNKAEKYGSAFLELAKSRIAQLLLGPFL